MNTENTVTRPLHMIAEEILKDWKKPYFGAVPYLEAMLSLNTMSDMYFMDNADSVVIYFLGNAQTWKGDTARRVKAELKKMAGVK